MKLLPAIFIAAVFSVALANAQIPLSGGTYRQSFDSLANTGSVNGWVDNFTLPGWYAARSASPNSVTNYIANAGSRTTGSLYSFGTTAAANRALGVLVSSTPGNLAFGLRFTNDTASAQSNLLISFTGEQWRTANAAAQTLTFSYRIGNALTNADGAGQFVWTPFSALNFTTPVTGSSGAALDGTASANQIIFTNVPLAGVVVQSGQELFLRWWLARPSSGSSPGVAIDNLTISFQAAGNSPPIITTQPQNEAAGEGGLALFSVAASGSPLPSYQWQLNATNLPDATNATLLLNSLKVDQAGNYSVRVTNLAGATNSATVTLIVAPTTLLATNNAIKILTYNVAGNNSGTATNAADWSTNAPQVQAIGRELMYLNPDIVTFNEIPVTNGIAQMPAWMKAFLPGFFLATNSTGDGYIQSVIASRFPIISSASHLAFSSLAPFDYTGSSFTRDLFEAQIAVPNWPLPLHVFVAHLKSTGTSNPQDDANKRAAMAAAVSNYFATVFLPGTNGAQPYVLDGDLNEDAFFPDANYVSGRPIQRLTSTPTGLQMTIPVNPVTHADLTESIQDSLDTRFDYILPCALLFSNVVGSEVFRTDLLANLPPNLFGNDDVTASDHLPVLAIFQNPFDTPFKIISITHTNGNLMLNWESQNNRTFDIEASTDLTTWVSFATNIATRTTNSPCVFSTNPVAAGKLFFRIHRTP
jgi:endonuclease/exonuclease/phosphatase family metal-dependent hydrolase